MPAPGAAHDRVEKEKEKKRKEGRERERKGGRRFSITVKNRGGEEKRREERRSCANRKQVEIGRHPRLNAIFEAQPVHELGHVRRK